MAVQVTVSPAMYGMQDVSCKVWGQTTTWMVSPSFTTCTYNLHDLDSGLLNHTVEFSPWLLTFTPTA